jgi:hypothetical protein
MGIRMGSTRSAINCGSPLVLHGSCSAIVLPNVPLEGRPTNHIPLNGGQHRSKVVLNIQEHSHTLAQLSAKYAREDNATPTETDLHELCCCRSRNDRIIGPANSVGNVCQQRVGVCSGYYLLYRLGFENSNRRTKATIDQMIVAVERICGVAKRALDPLFISVRSLHQGHLTLLYA